jgi:dTDP-4-amino-4,6-dideoxygalactose transaminase
MASVEEKVGLRVPFVDLGRAHEGLAESLLDAFGRLIETGDFTNGKDVARFEEAFAAHCGVVYAVGTASGLDALRLSLLAADLREGDEVIVPASTFVATFEAVTQAGGRPVPVDVTESDYGIDPAAAADAVNEKARFVVPVHLYGQMCDMRALGEIARAHDLFVLEDACQAHGAERDGLRAGGAGNAAAFSFYPGKNLGAFGDAGAVVTDDARVAARIRSLREHGQREKYEHEVPGWTSRLDTIQALVLAEKLPKLDRWTEQRRAAAALYDEALAGVGDLVLPPVPAGSAPVWHLYVVRTARPAALATRLASRGIQTGRHYLTPPHLTEAYASLGYGRGAFPVSEALSASALSLPMFAGIAEAEIATVAAAITDFFANG